MLQKTRGIVLRFLRFKESSVIATVITEEFGTQAYIVNSVRTRKPRYSIALFQPLTLLDLVVYHKQNNDLHRISEIKCEVPLLSIPYNIQKTGIALFISEFLYRIIKHESHPQGIFQFIHSSILSLDHIPTGFQNFHLQFLLKLTRYLGFFSQSGSIVKEQLLQGDEHLRTELDDLMNKNYGVPIEAITNELRTSLLTQIIDFYRLHVENLGELRSIMVLHDVLNA